jgi:secreted trypsin-like serine protease
MGVVSKSSRRRTRLRLALVAVALVAGAGVASATVIIRDLRAVAQQAAPVKPPSHGMLMESETPAPEATTISEPPPNQILPFNAKLTSQDIPAKGGGVRSGACSGSLVAPQWVVTAGHCFRNGNDVRISGKPPYTMTVTIGKLKDSDPGGHTAEVTDVRQSKVNDLAVVKLSTPVEDIVPLTLAGKKPAVGQKLQFAGWGSLSATVIAPSDHLKRGEFTVAKIGQTTLEASPVATRTVENSPCPQDSGAPFFVSDDDRTGQLVAIVTDGPSCPQPGRETVARVDVVSDWIHEQTGNTSR